MTKKVWTYWHQGWEQAPSLVKQCRGSWVRMNPDYEVYSLDQNSLFNYINFPAGIDIRRRDLDIQKISALGRLTILSKYGGIWVDATVMCIRPLSAWLEEYYTAQFFAFRTPGKDRLMSNWFLAAEPDSVILQRLYKSFSDFYANNYFSNQGTAFGEMLLEYFGRLWCSDFRSTLKWHSCFSRKLLRVYPYFIFHYTFNKLILTDPECAKLWDRIKPFPAGPSHRLQELAASSDGIEEAMRDIDSGLVPVYKLDWRVDNSSPYWSAILQYLEGNP